MSTGLSPAAASLYGAGIAAATAILTTLLNVLVQSMAARRLQSAQQKELALARRTEQLNRLYGPLLLLLQQNRYLAEKLRREKTSPESWHLLDHIEEVTRNPVDLALAQQIVDINARIEELIIENAGLVHGPRPHESFAQFLGHSRVLRISMQEGRRREGEAFESFPKTLDDDVESAYAELAAENDLALREG
ncbi:MAG: hypothetical protein AB7I38_16630 [Dehalococcoidia bacterium]